MRCKGIVFFVPCKRFYDIFKRFFLRFL